MYAIRGFRLLPLVFALCGGLFLAACESDDEKAERYYQSGLALLETGDEERALIEFRNVFKYNGFHKEARQLYADTIFDLGRTDEAYSQYLRLVEQYPDTVEARRRLAEIAVTGATGKRSYATVKPPWPLPRTSPRSRRSAWHWPTAMPRSPVTKPPAAVSPRKRRRCWKTSGRTARATTACW